MVARNLAIGVGVVGVFFLGFAVQMCVLLVREFKDSHTHPPQPA
jgi:hypothetical protein